MKDAKSAYSEAITSGKYDRGQTYYSKYDCVRIFWEDALTRNYIKPAVAERLEYCREQNRGIRILDLGCGSGDGFEMFLHIPADENDLVSDTNKLIAYDEVERYTGLDLNEDLLKLNQERWGDDPVMSFCQGDLTNGLPSAVGETPYDVYFMGYGTPSHFHRDETVRLFSDIVRHADNGSVIIGDWLGRFSYEWRDIWDSNIADEQWMDYFISYIYPPEERKHVDLSVLKLRLVTSAELEKYVIGRVKEETGADLKVKGWFDRSVFIGRHMDTGDYNPHTPHLRQTVNSLFERGQRTPLKNLLIDFHPHNANEQENVFFRRTFNVWNCVVSQCAEMMYGEIDSPKFHDTNVPDFAMQSVIRFQSMLEHPACFYTDDIRADVLEMQLGFLLRSLETEMQQGRGNGHGLIGVFEVQK